MSATLPMLSTPRCASRGEASCRSAGAAPRMPRTTGGPVHLTVSGLHAARQRATRGIPSKGHAGLCHGVALRRYNGQAPPLRSVCSLGRCGGSAAGGGFLSAGLADSASGGHVENHKKHQQESGHFFIISFLLIIIVVCVGYPAAPGALRRREMKPLQRGSSVRILSSKPPFSSGDTGRIGRCHGAPFFITAYYSLMLQ